MWNGCAINLDYGKYRRYTPITKADLVVAFLSIGLLDV